MIFNQTQPEIALDYIWLTFLDDLYDNIARNQEKENRRKKRTQTIDQYEEHTYTGPSSALIVFGEYFNFIDSR